VVGAGTMGSGIAGAAKLGGRKEENANFATAGAER
jgi:3-hydroxyacyl-CoA dehydrogenase